MFIITFRRIVALAIARKFYKRTETETPSAQRPSFFEKTRRAFVEFLAYSRRFSGLSFAIGNGEVAHTGPIHQISLKSMTYIVIIRFYMICSLD